MQREMRVSRASVIGVRNISNKKKYIFKDSIEKQAKKYKSLPYVN